MISYLFCPCAETSDDLTYDKIIDKNMTVSNVTSKRRVFHYENARETMLTRIGKYIKQGHTSQVDFVFVVNDRWF